MHHSFFENWHMKQRMSFRLLCRAIGYDETAKPASAEDPGFDQLYVQRLVFMARDAEKRLQMPLKALLFALDQVYKEDGTVDKESTSFFVPNDYCWQVCQQHSDIFVPVVSIHPFKPDAIEELRLWAGRGVKFVKLLPNIQLIDLTHSKIKEYFAEMARLKMTLICHTGVEKSTTAGGTVQWVANPLYLRIPLDLGVRVIAAHCGGEGTMPDLDNPTQTKHVHCVDLFARLMGEEKYRGQLFGDIAAMIAPNRAGYQLRKVIQHNEWHRYLINGSDFPLPAIGSMYGLGFLRLFIGGCIKFSHCLALREIHTKNPLLADLALKRLVRVKSHGKEERISDIVFLQSTRLMETYTGVP
jgi:hypothetical protein